MVLLLYGFLLYLVLGVLFAIAFVTVGVSRVQTQPVTAGARLLLLPASAALWPLVLVRWLKVR